MKKIASFTIISMLAAAAVFAQTTNPKNLSGPQGSQETGIRADPEVFLQGDYIDLGIEASGSSGTLGDPPGGYHFYGDNPGGLGFVADHNLNGWAVGSPAFSGDYFLPGWPFEGWLVEFTFDGDEYTFKNCGATGVVQIPQTSLTNTSAGTTNSALWIGTATGAGQTVEVQQNFNFLDSDGKFHIDVTLTNTSTVPLYDVEYARAVDPDMEVNLGGQFVTSNYVQSQPSGSSTMAEVRSFGIDFQVPMSLQLDHPNAKAHVVSTGDLEIYSPNEVLDGTFAPSQAAPYVNDVGVAVAVRFPVLNPGQSESFQVTYLLNEQEVSLVPVSNWALALMIGLIAIFTIIRFRRMS